MKKTVFAVTLLALVFSSSWAFAQDGPDTPPNDGSKLPNKMRSFANLQPAPHPGFKPIMSGKDPRFMNVDGNYIAVTYFNGNTFGGSGGAQGLVGFALVNMNPGAKGPKRTDFYQSIKSQYAPRNIVELVFNEPQNQFSAWTREKLEDRLKTIKSFESLFPELAEDEALLPMRVKVNVANPDGFQPYVGDLIPFGSEIYVRANTTIIKKIATDGDRCLVKIIYQQYLGDWTVADDFPTLINLTFFLPQNDFKMLREAYLAFINVVSVEHYNLEVALKTVGQNTDAEKERVRQLLQQK